MTASGRTISPRVIVQMLFFIVVIPFTPLIISGRWGWWQAWAYAAICILGFAVSRGLVARRHPDLLAERARFMQHADAAPFDKLLAPLVGLGGGLIPVVAGVDALLEASPSVPIGWQLAALGLILAGYAFGTWVLLENRFFSGMVRIQSDRGHQVVTSGPYAWMRHPGYAGALWTYLATPIFLEALWAFIPVALLTIVLVVRTRLEDRWLHEHLPGYAEYAQRVRYRLLPGVW